MHKCYKYTKQIFFAEAFENLNLHCLKSVQIRSFFWSETGKYRPKKTPYLDIFHVVLQYNRCQMIS